jgi:hypothetical protein
VATRIRQGGGGVVNILVVQMEVEGLAAT